MRLPSLALGLAAGAASLALAACAPAASPVPATPAPSTPAAGAASTPVPAPSGEVVVYTSRATALFDPVVQEFNRTYPNVRVTVLQGDNTALGTRLLEEQNSPRADVLINSDTISMADLASRGLFQPNPSPEVARVPASLRAEDGSWTALTLRPRVIMFNTNLVNEADVPTTLAGLADPKWRGQVASADSRNGAMMGQLAVQRAIQGEPATESWLRGLVANVGNRFFSGHTDVRRAVGSGEVALGLVNHYYYHLSRNEGAPVGVVYPDQGPNDMGLIVNSTNAGLVKGARNADNARLFIDFMLSPAGQQIYAEKNFEYPVTPGVALAEGVLPISNLKQQEQVSLKGAFDLLAPTRLMAQRAGLP